MAKFTYVSDVISPDQEAKWDRQRRNAHRITDLRDGFSFKADGRSGFIYYREQGRIAELFWEMSGEPEYDILVNTFGLRTWIWPDKEPIGDDDRVRILSALERWLIDVKYRAELSEKPY